MNSKRIVVDPIDVNEVRVGKKCAPSLQSQDAGVGQNSISVSTSTTSNMQTSGFEGMELGSSGEVHNEGFLSDLLASLFEVPMEVHRGFESSSASFEPSNDTNRSTTFDHDKYTFCNKNHKHKKMLLSMSDYHSLMLGKDIQFYHPKSGAFLRVRPLNQKTTQSGTLHDDKSWEATVPTSPSSETGHSRDASAPSPSPLPKEYHREDYLESTENEIVKFVQEEVTLQVNKKHRLSSGSSYASHVSMVQFQFEAVKEECSSKQFCRKADHFSKQTQISWVSINLKRRTLLSSTHLISFCRYSKTLIAGMKAKRHEGYPVQFDDHFPPFKKSRIADSIWATSNYSSTSWMSCSLEIFRSFPFRNG